MRFHDEWQVRPRTDAPYRVFIANGPPDTETFDRRRVDPPAGCRAAAEPAICPCGGPSTILHTIRLVDQPARRRVASLVAQETLDIRDQVVAGRQPLLVVHGFQPLDVAARGLVEAGSGVEPRSQLACLLFQLARRDGGAE